MIDIETFYRKQLEDWEQARNNFALLEQAQYKSFDFPGYTISTQYNPGRMVSSKARIDINFISQRPCFLCKNNRPDEQIELDFKDRYYILVNPYPIAPYHLVIADKEHCVQNICGRVEDMIDLATELSDYTILYNGPQAGASAPDHFHFQAIKKGFLPVKEEVENFVSSYPSSDKRLEMCHLRRCVILRAGSKDELTQLFDETCLLLQKQQNTENEAKMNLILWQDGSSFVMLIFPRKQHRPYQFDETGDKQILIGPGVVDMGGILVTPRKEDFEKIDKDLLINIYTQLTWKEKFL